jgi:endonuclease/exonuclease/phosphatase family metal-dependent hydrolase
MLLKKNLIDDYIFHENHVIKIIYYIIYYICNIPCRIINLFLINYYLWFYKPEKYDIIENTDNEHIEGKIIGWNIQYGNNLFMKNTFSEMLEYLKKERPQFIVLQEVLKSKNVNQIEILKKQLNFNHSFFHPNMNLNGVEIGNLILSNAAINNVFIGNKFQSIEINYKGKNINIVNVHLTFDITRKKQKKEIEELLRFVESSTIPCLIVGDFNLVSFSSTIKKLNKHLNLVTNNNYTYPSNYPLYQIDYVYTKNLIANMNVPQVTMSDHLPQVIYLTETDNN